MESDKVEAASQLNESTHVSYAEVRQYDDSALRFVQDLQKLVHQSDILSRYAFRGHACASHKLVPSLLRNPSIKRIIDFDSFYHDLVTKWEFPVNMSYFIRRHEGQLVIDSGTYNSVSVTANTVMRLIHAFTYQFIEDRLVKEFLTNANAKVYSYNYLHDDSSMPPPTPNIVTQGDILIGNAIQEYLNGIQGKIYGELPSIVDLFSIPSLKQTSIAAHEEVPTSALDFTRDPLIAAWFACTHRTPDGEYDTEYISVTAFNEYQIGKTIHQSDTTPISPYHAYTYDTPKHGNDRAQAQKSILCLSGSFYHRLAFLHDVPTSDVLHHQLLSERQVYQFALHKSQIPELVKILIANGLDDAFVMQRTSRLVEDVVRRILDARATLIDSSAGVMADNLIHVN